MKRTTITYPVDKQLKNSKTQLLKALLQLTGRIRPNETKNNKNQK